MRPRADGFIAVHTARTNDPDRRLLFFHYARLHTAGMRAQEPVRVFMYVESILHVAGRMIRRQVQRSEIMPVVFDLRSFGNRKSKPAENLHDAVADQADGMPGAGGDGVAGKGEVNIVDG